MGTQQNIVEVLTVIEHLEISVATLYRLYAEKFVDDPDVRDLFSELAEEEIHHANLASLSKSMIESSLLTKPRTFEDTGIRNFDLSYLVDFLSLCIHEAASTEVEDALRIALKIEKSVAENYLEIEVGKAYPSIRDLLRDLSTSPKGDNHHDRVQRLICSRPSD